MRPVNNVYGGSVGRSRLLEKLLRDSGRMNNGTTTGGLAHMLQSGMAGYLQGQERQAEQKAVADEGAAMAAMNRGMSAQQWQPPEGEALYAGAGADAPQISREQFMEQQPQAGGYGGAITALQGLGADNQAAGRLTSQLTMAKMDRDQSRADLIDQRGWEREMFELEQGAANGRLDREQAGRLSLLRERARIDAASRPPVPTYETVENPYGRGGIGQKNSVTGKIENYQPAPGPNSTFEGTDPTLQNYNILGRTDPGSPEYYQAWKRLEQGTVKTGTDGTFVTIPNSLEGYPPPTWSPNGSQSSAPPPIELPPIVGQNNYGPRVGMDPTQQGVAPQPAPRSMEPTITQMETPEMKREKALRIEQLDGVIGNIDGILNDPALPNALGPIDSRLPTVRSDTARVEEKMASLQGKVFLEGIERLKGTGTVTEVEGQKAERAIAAIGSGLSEEDYREAAKEVRSIFARAKARLQGVPENELPPIYVPKSSRPQGGQPANNAGGGQMNRDNLPPPPPGFVVN